MRAREPEGRIGQLELERIGEVAEGVQVGGRQPDEVAVRHDDPVGGTQPPALHRTLHAVLELDGLQPGTEEARGRPLEDPFEEPLQGGEGTHGRGRSLAGVPLRTRRRGTGGT